MQKRDFYDILEVPKGASADEIKAAYRKMALKYHPDRNPGNKEAEDKFKEAAEAYEVLSDDQKRRQYDQFGHADMHSGHTGHPGGMNMDDIFENFGDIFGSMFGGGGSKERRKSTGPEPRTGHDLGKEIEVSLKDAYLGTKIDMSIYHFFPCESCNHTGCKTGTKPQTCTTCRGTGQISQQQGFFMFASPCGACGGEGFKIPSPCPNCKGQSRVQKYDKFTVTIPKGIFDGAEMRIPGKGDAGIYGGKSGDLFIKIHVQEDKKFRREGNDLVCSVMLTYPQLVLGCQLEIENIDGTKESVKIPRGCPVGERIVIPGKGFTKIRSEFKGNLIVTTQCHIPKKISSQAKEKLNEYSTLIGTDAEQNDGSILGFFKKFLG